MTYLNVNMQTSKWHVIVRCPSAKNRVVYNKNQKSIYSSVNLSVTWILIKKKRMIYAIDVAKKRKVRDISKCVYNFTVGLSLHIKCFKRCILTSCQIQSNSEGFFFLLNLPFHKDLCKEKLSEYRFGDLICIKWVVSQETKAQLRYHCKKSHEGYSWFKAQ